MKSLTGGTKIRKVILPFLTSLEKLDPQAQHILLSHLDDESCKILCQIVYTVVKRAPKLEEGERAFLTQHIGDHGKNIRCILNGKESIKKKKRALTEIGGNPLLAILGTAVPILFNLVRGAKSS